MKMKKIIITYEINEKARHKLYWFYLRPLKFMSSHTSGVHELCNHELKENVRSYPMRQCRKESLFACIHTCRESCFADGRLFVPGTHSKTSSQRHENTTKGEHLQLLGPMHESIKPAVIASRGARLGRVWTEPTKIVSSLDTLSTEKQVICQTLPIYCSTSKVRPNQRMWPLYVELLIISVLCTWQKLLPISLIE